MEGIFSNVQNTCLNNVGKKKILNCLIDSLNGLNSDLLNYLKYLLKNFKLSDSQFIEILSGAWTVLDDNGIFFSHIIESYIQDELPSIFLLDSSGVFDGKSSHGKDSSLMGSIKDPEHQINVIGPLGGANSLRFGCYTVNDYGEIFPPIFQMVIGLWKHRLLSGEEKTFTWFQIENSPGIDLAHAKDFLTHKTYGVNVGPCGLTSRYTEGIWEKYLFQGKHEEYDMFLVSKKKRSSPTKKNRKKTKKKKNKFENIFTSI